MIRKLYLVRHATAEEGSYSAMLPDFNRELNSKGIMEAARMGNYLNEQGEKFDTVVSSAAFRALSTAKIFVERQKFDADEIVVDESIYGGGPRSYLAALNALENDCTSVAIFGHNPDISFFAEYLTRDDTEGNMGKATVICLKVEDLAWSEISSKSMSLVFRKTISELDEK